MQRTSREKSIDGREIRESQLVTDEQIRIEDQQMGG